MTNVEYYISGKVWIFGINIIETSGQEFQEGNVMKSLMALETNKLFNFNL